MNAEEFIAGSGWRFAKTMPGIPHEYTVRDLERPERSTGLSAEAFESFVREIRARGVNRDWCGREFTYLVVGDYEYWTMGEAAEETTIINRQRTSSASRRSS